MSQGRLLGRLTSCVSAGSNFRSCLNKTSFSFDVKDCLVSQGMLGRSKKVLQAQKKLHHLFEDGLWAVLCLSFHVVEKWEDGLHGPQISGLSSLEPLMLLNPKPETARPRRENLKDLWSVSCHESYLSHEKYEGWLCCFVYNITRTVASNGRF